MAWKPACFSADVDISLFFFFMVSKRLQAGVHQKRQRNSKSYDKNIEIVKETKSQQKQKKANTVDRTERRHC